MREYKILADFTLFKLQESVNLAIKLGWQPVGGVSVVYSPINIEDTGAPGFIYNQAMGK